MSSTGVIPIAAAVYAPEQIDDAVSKILDAMRSNGYEPALRIEASMLLRRQQESTATWPSAIDLMQPIQAYDLRQRPASISMQLVHTEEVTGSIPVSPTQLSGRVRSWNRPILIFRQQQNGSYSHASQSLSLRTASRIASDGASV